MDLGKKDVDLVGGQKDFSLWPVRILGPAPGLKEMNLACWGLFAALLVTRFCYPLWIQYKTGVGSFHIRPADFIYFYGIGRIANEYSITKLYDYGLQLKTFNEIYPLHDGAYGPSPYPPFVALFFSSFARISFVPAFFLWAGVSLALYLAGIAAAVKGFFPGERLKVSLIFCFALAFAPFLYSTLANGQIGTAAVCAVGLAIALEIRSRLFSSGLALSILTYKPTLLLLLIPMLLLTRRFRTLYGFITGAVLLILATTACAGTQIWTAYAHFLYYFGRVAGLNGQPVLRLWKYVDFSSFFQTICGGRSMTETVLFISVTGMIAAALAVLLWKSAGSSSPAQSLAWAATLTWTLLLNVYVPVYDCVLATIAVVLTLGALKELEWSAAMRWAIFLSVVLLMASWETDAMAISYGIQLLTILLAVFGLGQLYLLRRVIERGLPQKVSQLPVG
jgi:hypothetical protein